MKKELTPEVALARLNASFRFLFECVSIIDDVDLIKKLKIVYRKTHAAQVLHERNVIAISGLQGVGKSTLLNLVYDFPEDLIPRNVGIGEKLPVLLTESHIGGFETLAWRFKQDEDGNLVIEQQSLVRSEIHRMLTSPSYDDILAEIIVPSKLDMLSGRSLLLLPGLDQSRNDDYDQLADYALTCSAACVFVFDHATFVNRKNKETFEEIKSNFGASHPIIVITHADVSEDGNVSLRESFIKEFDIPDGEHDRVIVSGTSDVYRQNVPKQLRDAIWKYGFTQRSFREKQIEKLVSVAGEELGRLLSDLRMVIENLETEGKAPSRIIEGHMQKIDESAQIFRRTFVKKITRELDERASPNGATRKSIHVEIRRWSPFGTLWDQITGGMSYARQQELNEAIGDCWRESGGVSLSETYTVALNATCEQHLKIYQGMATEAKQIQGMNDFDKKRLLIGERYVEDGDEINQDYVITPDHQQNLRVLFVHSPDDLEYGKGDKFTRALPKTLKIIPVLGLEFSRFINIFPELNPKYLNENWQGRIRDAEEHFNFLTGTSGRIVKSSAIFLGVDIAADGKIDSIPALLKGLGMGAKTIPTFVPIVGGAILSTAGIISIARMIKGGKDAMNNFADQVIDKYHDQTLEICKQAFDDSMGLLRTYVREAFSDYYKEDVSYHRVANIEHASACLCEVRQNLLELCHVHR